MSKKFIIFLLFMPQFFYGQWVQQVSGTNENLNDIFCVTEDLVFAVGDDGTILKTTDGGATWVQKTSGTTNQLRRVQFATSTVGYAVGFNGVLLKTTNGGDIWTVIATGTATSIYGLSVIDETTVMITGENGLIKKTIDGGTIFIDLIVPENNIISDIQFIDEYNGFVQIGSLIPFSNDSKLFKTINGGISLQLLVAPIDSFYFVNKDIGFINNPQNHTIFKTIDAGSNFFSVSFSNNLENDIFSVNGDIVWDIGFNQTLCNCATSCVKKSIVFDSNTNNCNSITVPLNTIYFANENVGFVAGYGGSIFKNSTGNNNPLASENFYNKKNIKIYPIPTSDKLNISFDEKISKICFIEINDNLGKIIFSKFYFNENEISIDTQNFSKGIYFLNVTSGESKQTQKLIIN